MQSDLKVLKNGNALFPFNGVIYPGEDIYVPDGNVEAASNNDTGNPFELYTPTGLTGTAIRVSTLTEYDSYTLVILYLNGEVDLVEITYNPPTHQKVYGVCENKCKIEVIPKESLILVEGTAKSVSGNSQKEIILKESDLGLPLPLSNYMVIAADMATNDLYWDNNYGETNYQYRWPYVRISRASTTSGKINLYVYNESSSTKDIPYRLLFLKVT